METIREGHLRLAITDASIRKQSLRLIMQIESTRTNCAVCRRFGRVEELKITSDLLQFECRCTQRASHYSRTLR